MQNKPFTKLELQLLECFWRDEETPLSTNDITAYLYETYDCTLRTIQNGLNSLVEKGAVEYVGNKTGKSHLARLYKNVLTREEYVNAVFCDLKTKILPVLKTPRFINSLSFLSDSSTKQLAEDIADFIKNFRRDRRLRDPEFAEAYDRKMEKESKGS